MNSADKCVKCPGRYCEDCNGNKPQICKECEQAGDSETWLSKQKTCIKVR